MIFVSLPTGCFELGFPRRHVILLLEGDKTGDKRWYEVNVPIADRLDDAHLEELTREGLI